MCCELNTSWQQPKTFRPGATFVSVRVHSRHRVGVIDHPRLRALFGDGLSETSEGDGSAQAAHQPGCPGGIANREKQPILFGDTNFVLHIVQ